MRVEIQQGRGYVEAKEVEGGLLGKLIEESNLETGGDKRGGGGYGELEIKELVRISLAGGLWSGLACTRERASSAS